MALTSSYLQQNSIDSLKTEYKIHVGHHPSLPLIVLNYDPVNSEKNDPLVEECRGLVLEETRFRIIASGMPRFYNSGEKGVIDRFNHENIVRCEHKEDGTLLHLFHYNGEWVLATRYNFSEDRLGDVTYQELFEQISGCRLSDLGESLDKSVTFCLEMCSKRNAIVKLYERPMVYLLAAYKNGVELEYGDVDALIDQIDLVWHRPKSYTDINTYPQIFEKMDELLGDDPLFEGFVLVDSDGKRIKLKTALYRVIHKLKYRGWSCMTEATVLPLIQSGSIDYIFTVLSFYRNPHEMEEFRERYAAIKGNYEKGIKSKGNQFLDNDHPREYCRMDAIPVTTDIATEAATDCFGEMSTKIPIKQDDGSWVVTCVCGQQMELQKIRVDFSQYKRCHCGSKFGIKLYPVGSLLYICPACNLTHEAHQRRMEFDSGEVVEAGQPTGIPASDRCKNLRLYIHQLINQIIKKFDIERHRVYQRLASILNCERRYAHVGRLDCGTCREIIIKFQELLDGDKF